MNSSKTVTLITLTLLIVLLIIPIQSIPTRHKRWTFNSWSLFGRQYTPQTTINPTTESYSSTISSNVNHQDQSINVSNDDGDSYQILLHLLKFFQMLDHEQKEDGIKYFSEKS